MVCVPLKNRRHLSRLRITDNEQSKHIPGLAVDVVAYIGPRVSWEVNLYDDIADAFKIAAIELGTGIRWGAVLAYPRHS